MFAPPVRTFLMGVLVFGLLPHASGQEKTPSASLTTARSTKSYGNLSLSFEDNQGQAASGVRFVARGQGYAISLTDSAALLTLAVHDSKKRSSGKSFARSVVRMELAGASAHARVEGEDRLEGTANYFIGNDPAKWLSGIQTYGRVKYAGVYPGVDLVYYGNQRQLEYDFVVAPGADPKQVQLRFAGSNGVRLTAGGDLEVMTRKNDIVFHKPVVYQSRNGQRDEVDGRFVLLAGNTVGFTVGEYDHSKPLVIDPVLVYSTYLGGSNDGNFGGDYAAGIAVDTAGNAYITGQAESTDFPVTSSAYQSVNKADASQAFVSKLNLAGTALIYSTYFGGSSGEYGAGIAVDASGNAYITGKATSSDFPVTPGAFQTVNHGNASGNSFVTKFNASGSALIYSTYLGGNGPDISAAITLDSSGNAYITGKASSTNFPTTTGAFQTTRKASNGPDAFVTKLNSTGTGLVFSTYLGGSTEELGTGIAVGVSGNVFVTGQAYSIDFPTTSGAFQTTVGFLPDYGDSNAFVTKLNSTGTALIYSTYLGGNYSDHAYGIAVDSSGEAYVTGVAYSANFPVTSGAFQTTKLVSGYGFVTKFNSAGTALLYSTFLGGSNAVGHADYGSGIAIDAFGDAYVTGTDNSPNFPVTANGYQTVNPGNFNAFVSELNPTGTALLYSSYLGGSAYDIGNGIAIDSTGNVYVVGATFSDDFPVSDGAFQGINRGFANGDPNGFIAKLSVGPAPAVLTAPVAGSILSGTAATTFTWTTGTEVTSYQLKLGTTGAGSSDLYNSGTTAALTKAVGPFPAHGGTIFATLSSLIAGVWKSNNYTFVELGTPAPAVLTAPVAGSTLSGTTATVFTWTTGTGVTSYQLKLGTTGVGSYDLYNSGPTTILTKTVSTFPANGGRIFATLSSLIDGVWKNNNYTFVESGTPAPAVLTAPVAGSTLSGTAAIAFTWTAGTGVTSYQLQLGTTGAGSSDLYNSGSTTVLAKIVGPLPAHGGTVFATLSSLINGVWKNNNYTFVESGTPALAILTKPVAGSTLSGTAATTFTWTAGTGVTDYQLKLGTTGVASSDIYFSGTTAVLTKTVGPIPANGGTIFATLSSLIDGVWKNNNYTFVESGTPVPAVLTAPVAGTTLSGTAATTFTWTAGIGVTSYQLQLGTTGAGSHDLYNSGTTAVLTKNVGPIPAHGGTVFATLSSLIDGVWKNNNYIFIESGTPVAAVLKTPVTGSTLSGTAATTFTWTAGTGVTSYQLQLGTTGAGSYNLYNSGLTSVLTESVGPIPANGGTVFATLSSLIDGVWKSNNYTFVESGTPVAPVLLTPAPGSTLAGANVTFTWSTGSGVTAYQLWLGTSGVGSQDLFNSGVTGATSAAVTGLPLTGVTVYATLYAQIDGVWKTSNYTYTASNAAALPQAETVLYNFTGNNGTVNTGQWSPTPGMVMDSQGNLYGTTEYSGLGANYAGTVFKLTPSGKETVLHVFDDNGTDGFYPNGGLVMDATGNVYGTTRSGGANFNDTGTAGTVFKVTPAGAVTILYSLGSQPGDGVYPNEGLIIDGNGNLYGTTTIGGNTTGCGTVFRVTPGGTETVLYSFSGPDGCDPGGGDISGVSNGGPGLVMDSTGNIFGTTYLGGANGYGTVFKLAPNGTETVLHSFAKDGTDGYAPLGGLALDSQGNLYGTAASGGDFLFGTIFKVTPNGTESVLFSFNTDLSSVQPGLILDSHQNLYGATSGDEPISGTVFQLAPSGVLTVLHQFPGYPGQGDGSYPQGGLLLAANGKLYGTTSGGNATNSGTVFELSPSANVIAPPVFSVAPGTYSSAQTITISDATPGATIYYSVGSAPDSGEIANSYSGTLYGGPVTISSTSGLSAIAVAPGGATSAPILADYRITAAP